jgi:hypothetical protein
MSAAIRSNARRTRGSSPRPKRARVSAIACESQGSAPQTAASMSLQRPSARNRPSSSCCSSIASRMGVMRGSSWAVTPMSARSPSRFGVYSGLSWPDSGVSASQGASRSRSSRVPGSRSTALCAAPTSGAPAVWSSSHGRGSAPRSRIQPPSLTAAFFAPRLLQDAVRHRGDVPISPPAGSINRGSE